MKDLTLKYCTYFTFYSGNKLPPFYIGYGMVYKILNRNYHGSVASNHYKNIWASELENNPHLFKTVIINTYTTRLEAQHREEYLQRYFNVIRNNMYINMGIGASRSNNIGTIIINNGNKECRILRGQPIPNGYIAGRTNKTRAKIRKSLVNKPHIFSEKGMEKLCNLHKGKLKSTSTKQKISDAKKGKTFIIMHGEEKAKELVENHKIRMRDNNPMQGKHHSEKSSALISAVHKNKVTVRDNNGNTTRISREEYLNNDELVGCTSGCFFITNGLENSIIFNKTDIPDGWYLGRVLSTYPIWITPLGEFNSSIDAAQANKLSINVIKNRCTKNTNIIKSVSKCTDYNHEIIGKTFKELGWGKRYRNG
jgi:hypothetical protein